MSQEDSKFGFVSMSLCLLMMTGQEKASSRQEGPNRQTLESSLLRYQLTIIIVVHIDHAISTSAGWIPLLSRA